VKSRQEYEAKGYADAAASGSFRLAECPYSDGWQRDAWQTGAWRWMQEQRKSRALGSSGTRVAKRHSAQIGREIKAALAGDGARSGRVPVTRLRAGQRVVVRGDAGTSTLEAIPDGELVKVFEDYGQSHVNVMRDNGQLRAVARSSVK
jgi:hypothetical protein